MSEQENLLPENIPRVNDTHLQEEIIESKSENMEVHKHPHHVTHKKKWVEYVLEFFMLFLAVFLGFLAENIREGRMDHAKEVEYMHSMVQDLETDRYNLKLQIEEKKQVVSYCDTLIHSFKKREFASLTSDLYFFGRQLMARNFFYMTDGTVQQLRNGGFRLIHNNKIVDSIQSYILSYNSLNTIQQLEESQIIDYRHQVGKIFDVFIFDKMLDGMIFKKPEGNPALLSVNKQEINEILMTVHGRERNVMWQIVTFAQLSDKASKIIEMIKKQYSF